MDYRRAIKRPLLILYKYNFVEDDEFWDEIAVLCDFATSVTERDKVKQDHPQVGRRGKVYEPQTDLLTSQDLRGYSPEKDSMPVEFIYVQ